MRKELKRYIKQVLAGMLSLTLLQSPVFLLQTNDLYFGTGIREKRPGGNFF